MFGFFLRVTKQFLRAELHALEARDAKRGLASLCIGGGEAVALTVER